MYILSIALAVFGSVCYHLSGRAIDRRLPLWIALAVAYGTAFALVVVAGVAGDRKHGISTSLAYVNWATFGLAVGIVLIEAGFVLAYRAGWTVSTASLVANVTAALLLVAIGRVLLQETLPPVAHAGIALAVVALVLLNWPR
jgi:multidrug transporter EmrE-like cation transporter